MKLHLAKFVHSSQGRILMSVILGFGFATFFRATCEGSDCMIRVAPPQEAMHGSKIYSFNGKCFSLKKQDISCSKVKTEVIPFTN